MENMNITSFLKKKKSVFSEFSQKFLLIGIVLLVVEEQIYVVFGVIRISEFLGRILQESVF